MINCKLASLTPGPWWLPLVYQSSLISQFCPILLYIPVILNCCLIFCLHQHILLGLRAFTSATCSTWTHSSQVSFLPSYSTSPIKHQLNTPLLSSDIIYSKLPWDEKSGPSELAWHMFTRFILALTPGTEMICLGFSFWKSGTIHP